MRTFFFICMLLGLGLNSCKKTDDQKTLLLNDQNNFDYYAFVERIKATSYVDFLGKNIVPTVNVGKLFDAGFFHYLNYKRNLNKSAVVNNPNELSSEIPKNDNLNLSSYDLMSENQLSLITPLINNIIQDPNNTTNISNLIMNFDQVISTSNILTNEEKLLLAQFSGEMQAVLSFFSNNETNLFITDTGNGTYVMYIDKTSNSSSGGCKVNMGNIWRGAVIGFFVSGAAGAKAGSVGGSVTLPGIGTITGCIGGAVFGAAGGFIGGALTSAAADLLGTCFKKPGVKLVSKDDIVLTFKVEEDVPAKLYFPEEYLGQYFYTTSPDFINNPHTGPQHSTYVYLREAKYYFNVDKTCLLPEGYYYSTYDNSYYQVKNGNVISIQKKPEVFPAIPYPIEHYYPSPFDCNPLLN